MAMAAGIEMEAGGQPGGRLHAAAPAGLGTGTGTAPSGVGLGSIAQSSATESFRSSWQSMLSSLAGESSGKEGKAPAIETAGNSSVLTGSPKSTVTQDGLFAAVANNSVKAPRAAMDGPGTRRTSGPSSDAAHSIGWCKWSDEGKRSDAEVGAKSTPAAMNPAEPTNIGVAPAAVANVSQAPTEPDRMESSSAGAADLSQSLLAIPVTELGLTVSDAHAEIASGGMSDFNVATSARRAASFATAPNELRPLDSAAAPNAHSLNASTDITRGSEAKIHPSLSAAWVEQASSHRFATAPEQSVPGKAGSGIDRHGLASGNVNGKLATAIASNRSPNLEEIGEASADAGSGDVARSATTVQLVTTAPPLSSVSAGAGGTVSGLAANSGATQKTGNGTQDGLASSLSLSSGSVDQSSSAETSNVTPPRPSAEKRVGESDLPHGVHGVDSIEAGRTANLASPIQAGGGQGDASALAHNLGGAHAAMSGLNQGISLSGGGGISRGTAAGSTAGETFAALDAESGARPSWVHAGAQNAEAGFKDPALGWVGVRADLGAGAVHASVVPGSNEAAQALGGHMAGLKTYLSEQKSLVETVTLTAPADRDAGAGGAMQQGAGYGAGKGQSDASETQAGTQTAAQAFPVRSVTSVTEAPLANVGFEPYQTTANRENGHISVMA